MSVSQKNIWSVLKMSFIICYTEFQFGHKGSWDITMRENRWDRRTKAEEKKTKGH